MFDIAINGFVSVCLALPQSQSPFVGYCRDTVPQQGHTKMREGVDEWDAKNLAELTGIEQTYSIDAGRGQTITCPAGRGKLAVSAMCVTGLRECHIMND